MVFFVLAFVLAMLGIRRRDRFGLLFSTAALVPEKNGGAQQRPCQNDAQDGLLRFFVDVEFHFVFLSV
ncbi:hypothetical protein D3C86_2112680 [compost metagenome]